MARAKALATTVEKPIQKPVREKIRFMSDKDERVKLAARSMILLGYEGLYKHIAAPGALGKVLCELKIDPLAKISVEKYQEEVIRRARANAKPRPYTRVTFAWKARALQGYQKPVPEFVLNKAVQIAEKMPSVKFHIEELVSTVRSIDPDPFLVVSYGDERYYVEVWDEPRFEEKL